MYAGFAKEIVIAAQLRVGRCMSAGIPYARLDAIAQEADRLQFSFEFWAQRDPGEDARRAAIARLMDMRAEAKGLGADL